MRSLALAALLAAALVAGCTGAPAPSQAPPKQAPLEPAEVPVSAEPPPTPPPDDGALFVFPMHGKLTVAAHVPGFYLSPTGAVDPRMFPFVVEPGAASLVADLGWPNPAFDLDLELAPPGCDLTTGAGTCIFLDGGSPAAGDTPVHHEITDPALLNLTGTWYAIVWAKVAVNTSFDGAIAVAYPPAGEAAAVVGERA